MTAQKPRLIGVFVALKAQMVGLSRSDSFIYCSNLAHNYYFMPEREKIYWLLKEDEGSPMI